MPDPIDRRSFLARSAVMAAGVAGGGSLLAACSSGTSSGTTASGPRDGISTATPKRGGSIIFGTEAEEQGFDPATGRFDETGVLYARTVFDPLMIIAADGSVQPYLAQAMVPNTDFTEWTIYVRPGVHFHDGTPCDAAAIVGSINHFRSGELGVSLNVVKSVTVSSPNTVTIKISQPWVSFNAYFTGGIGGQGGYIVAPAMIANPNGTKQPIGTGPFKFEVWEPNDHFTATRNPHYWRSGLPYLDSVTYKPIVDADARANSLMAGTIDIMHTDVPVVLLEFRDNASYSYIDDSKHIVGEPDMNFIMCNTQAKPVNDIRVRQAMAMAISSPEYSKIVDKGVNAPTNQPFVPGSPYYAVPSDYPAYDQNQARQLVKQVAQDIGGSVSFTYGTTPDDAAIQAAQYLQDRLQAVGMHMQINTFQQSELINNALAGKYQTVGWRQFAATDPDLNYFWWSPTEIYGSIAPNFARNTDPVMETLLQKGRQSSDPAVRAQAYQQVAQRLNKDLPYIWNDRATWAIVAQPKVQNFNNPTTPAGQKAYGMIVGTIWLPQVWVQT